MNTLAAASCVEELLYTSKEHSPLVQGVFQSLAALTKAGRRRHRVKNFGENIAGRWVVIKREGVCKFKRWWVRNLSK